MISKGISGELSESPKKLSVGDTRKSQLFNILSNSKKKTSIPRRKTVFSSNEKKRFPRFCMLIFFPLRWEEIVGYKKKERNIFHFQLIGH